MTTFFLIAGFFAHMSFHSKARRRSFADRLKRIGVPLVVGWPILFALIVAATIWGALVTAHGRALPKAPPYPGFPAFPLTHLWFLYVLLLLYAATLVLRGAVALVDRSEHLRTMVDAAVRGLIGNPFGFVVLAAPTAIVLALQPAWLAWFGIPTPDSSLVPNASAATAFATAFGFRMAAAPPDRTPGCLAPPLVPQSRAGRRLYGVGIVVHGTRAGADACRA